MNSKHQTLINIIKYQDLPNGTVLIKIEDQLLECSISSLSVEMSAGSITEYTVKGYVNERSN